MTQTGRHMDIWDGYCCVHDRVTTDDICRAQEEHPEALVLVHPECRPNVVSMADCVASTSGIISFARQSQAKEFIVVTELGILYQLHKECPDKKFYVANEQMICAKMKKTTLEKVKKALATMQPQVTVAPDIREKALYSLERMLAVN
jgi:quinolinate synthase